MQKYTAIVAVITLAVGTPAFAAGPPKEERIGVGAGAVLGAVVGGPVGFIVGAAIGAKVGDTLYRKNSEIETLEASLADSEVRVAMLHADIGTLDTELQRLRDVARPELVRLLQAGIAVDLLFRTDEHVLTDPTGNRLARLAGVLAEMPDIRIQLDGFADERGAADYNLLLSQKRVESVREQLIAAGIDAGRIRATAFGESPAQDATADSYALERRVNLTVFIDDSPSFAANPD